MAKTTSQSIETTIERKEDQSIHLTFHIPWNEVVKAQEKVVTTTTKSAQVAGFRKGKAPKPLVEQTINQDRLKEEALRTLLPQYYMEAVNKHNIRPIMNPKIHVDKIEENKDWVITAITAEAPDVILKNYKEIVKGITAKSKIVIPGQEKKEVELNEILKSLLETVEIKIPQILIDQEVDRLLGQLLNEVKSLGLTLEQYMTSSGKSPEALRDDYTKKAHDDIAIEFLLQKIAEEEKIVADPKEVEEAIQKAKSPEEREHLQGNKYLLASIIRQQKTIDFLKSL